MLETRGALWAFVLAAEINPPPCIYTSPFDDFLTELADSIWAAFEHRAQAATLPRKMQYTPRHVYPSEDPQRGKEPLICSLLKLAHNAVGELKEGQNENIY